MQTDPRDSAPLSTPLPEDGPRSTADLEAIRAERRALAVFALIATAVIVWVAEPVGTGLLLGTLLAFSLQPFYDRVVAHTGRPRLTAAGFVVLSTLGLLTAIGGLSSLLVSRGMVIASGLIETLGPGGGLRETVQRMSARLGPLQLNSDEVTAKLHDAAADVASRAAALAAAIATTTFDLLLTLFFAMLALSFILQRWKDIARRAEDVMPLRPRYTRAILEELRRVGRTTLLGTVLTGVAQGALASLGYWMTGVPEAAFFGAATAVASLIPGVGTMLVWLPAGIYLISEGHVGMGVLELVWGGLVVVGISDYVIRPRLVGGHGAMPPLLTFVSLFGGVEVFGLSGLIVGPLLVSVSFAVLSIFAKDAEARRRRGEAYR